MEPGIISVRTQSGRERYSVKRREIRSSAKRKVRQKTLMISTLLIQAQSNDFNWLGPFRDSGAIDGRCAQKEHWDDDSEVKNVISTIILNLKSVLKGCP